MFRGVISSAVAGASCLFSFPAGGCAAAPAPGPAATHRTSSTFNFGKVNVSYCMSAAAHRTFSTFDLLWYGMSSPLLNVSSTFRRNSCGLSCDNRAHLKAPAVTEPANTWWTPPEAATLAARPRQSSPALVAAPVPVLGPVPVPLPVPVPTVVAAGGWARGSPLPVSVSVLVSAAVSAAVRAAVSAPLPGPRALATALTAALRAALPPTHTATDSWQLLFTAA